MSLEDYGCDCNDDFLFVVDSVQGPRKTLIPRELLVFFTSVEDFDFFDISNNEIPEWGVRNAIAFDRSLLENYNLVFTHTSDPHIYLIYVEKRGGQNA